MSRDLNDSINTRNVSDQFKNTKPSHYIWPNSNEDNTNTQYLQNMSYNIHPNKYSNQFGTALHHEPKPLRFDPKYKYIRPNINVKNNLNVVKKSTKSDSNKEDKKNDIIDNPQLDKIFKKTSKIIDKVLYNNEDSFLIKDNINIANSNDKKQIIANLNKELDMIKSKNKSYIDKSNIEKINNSCNLKKEAIELKDKFTSDLKIKKRKNFETENKNLSDKIESKKAKKVVDHKSFFSEAAQINSANKSIFSFSIKANNPDKNILKYQAVQIKCYDESGIPLPLSANKSSNNLFIFGTSEATDFVIPEKSFNPVFNIFSNENNDKRAKSLIQSKLNETFKDDNFNTNSNMLNKKMEKIIINDSFQSDDKVNLQEDTIKQNETAYLASTNDVCKLLSKYKLKKLLSGPKTRKDQITLENLLQSHYKAMQKSTKALRQHDLTNIDNLKLIPTDANLENDLNSVIDVLEDSFDLQLGDTSFDVNENIQPIQDFNLENNIRIKSNSPIESNINLSAKKHIDQNKIKKKKGISSAETQKIIKNLDKKLKNTEHSLIKNVSKKDKIKNCSKTIINDNNSKKAKKES